MESMEESKSSRISLRSFTVTTEDGKEYRRNTIDLRKTTEVIVGYVSSSLNYLQQRLEIIGRMY